MSIFSLGNNNGNNNNNLLIPDGAFILSQNRFYIEILLQLLKKEKLDSNLSSRLWNLLMRLPFNLQVLGSLKDIINQTQLQQQQQNNNNNNDNNNNNNNDNNNNNNND
eukprot:32080_1